MFEVGLPHANATTAHGFADTALVVGAVDSISRVAFEPHPSCTNGILRVTKGVGDFGFGMGVGGVFGATVRKFRF